MPGACMSSDEKPMGASHRLIHIAQFTQSRSFIGSAPTVSNFSSSKYSLRMPSVNASGMSMIVSFCAMPFIP